MKVVSSLRLLLIGTAIGLVLAACPQLAPPKPTPAPINVAPVPVNYTCDQQRQLRTELDTLPPGSMLEQAMGDYRVERKKLWAAHGVEPPVMCPSVAQ